MKQQTDPRTRDLMQIDLMETGLAQTGKMRCALFLPQYAKDPATGELHGVGTGYIAIETVRSLAGRLGVDAQFVECPTPAKAIEGLNSDAWDLAFLGIEPSRATEVAFSDPVFQFDYTYLVPERSAIRDPADADRPGIRIAVVRGHASDLALRRLVAHAEIVGAELPDTAFALLQAGKVDALAFPREHILDFSAQLPGSRALNTGYGINRVAMAVAKHRAAALPYLNAFIGEAKASGLIERIIAHGALRGFAVAQP
jgi:polar amino acid transport system substrate-binding protein